MNGKELAKLCNVHYNTIRNWLIKNKVKKGSKGNYIIDDEIIEKAKEHFIKDDNHKQESNKDSNNVSDNVVTSELQSVTYLIQQLEAKDRQIEMLSELLRNEQALNLKATEQIELFKSSNVKEKKQAQYEEQPKKSIFKRIFKK